MRAHSFPVMLREIDGDWRGQKESRVRYVNIRYVVSRWSGQLEAEYVALRYAQICHPE